MELETLALAIQIDTEMDFNSSNPKIGLEISFHFTIPIQSRCLSDYMEAKSKQSGKVGDTASLLGFLASWHSVRDELR